MRKSNRGNRVGLGLAALVGALGCAGRPVAEPLGVVELPAMGVAWQGSHYHIEGAYTLTGLDSDFVVEVPVSKDDYGVVRREVPAGRYRVALNSDFTLSWPNRPPSDDPLKKTKIVEGPDLVIVEAGKVARVELHSEPLPEAQLAQR